jgi:hypothetical protein
MPCQSHALHFSRLIETSSSEKALPILRYQPGYPLDANDKLHGMLRQ